MSSLSQMEIIFNDNRNKRNRTILGFLLVCIDANTSINISYRSLHKNIHFFQGKILNFLVDFYKVEKNSPLSPQLRVTLRIFR